MSSNWGPNHQRGPAVPVGNAGSDGYWWGIALGAVATAPHMYRVTQGGLNDWQGVVWLIVVMTGLAAIIGHMNRRRGKRFACGRWIAWCIATLAVLASCWGLPAIAYTAGYYWPELARLGRRGKSVARPATPRRTLRAAAGPPALPAIPGAWIGVDDRGQPVTASARGATICIGPPASGKTQGIILTTCAVAPPSPLVSASVKSEVLAQVWQVRAKHGQVFWFDPGGQEAPPAGVTALRWNPLVDVSDWDSARAVAARLTVAARSGDGDSHWIDRAEQWLAVLLFAAHRAGGDISALATWSMGPTAAALDVQLLLVQARDAGEPGAKIAITLHDSLLGAPDRERESIASTVGRLMNVYTSPAAIKAGTNPNFDPNKFVRSADSVFIGSPVDKQRDYAPLIVGLLESIRLAQYRRRQAVDLGRETQEYPISFVLDEIANVAPVRIDQWVSECGGQGIALTCALQDLSQARVRWGSEAASGFLTLFPDKIILRGVNDRATTAALSSATGHYDRTTISSSNTLAHHPFTREGKSAGYTYSTSREPVLSEADISGVPPGQGLHFSPRGWQLVTLTPWYKMRETWGV